MPGNGHVETGDTTKGEVYGRCILANNVNGISGCLSLSLTLQDFWKALLSIRCRVLAAAEGAWWVSPSLGAATPH